jgi:hypothetical protein
LSWRQHHKSVLGEQAEIRMVERKEAGGKAYMIDKWLICGNRLMLFEKVHIKNR